MTFDKDELGIIEQAIGDYIESLWFCDDDEDDIVYLKRVEALQKKIVDKLIGA